MKLNWFSPLPPARTEIAHYTMRMLSSLKEDAEITVWTEQTEWDDELNNTVEIRSYQLGQTPWEEFNQAHINIYNIANNPHFHSSIWQVSQRYPGIVILHDFRLQHLFTDIYFNQWLDLEGYLIQMQFYYGDAARVDAMKFYKRAVRGEAALYIDELTERYPLTHLALENALGVLVHTSNAQDQISRSNLFPVAYSPLPFVPSEESVQRFSNSTIHTDCSPYRLIIFGYIGPNRRLEELLSALAGFSAKDSFHLDIYGQLWDEKYIQSRIHSLGLEDLVTIHGFVEESELDAALSKADLAINLRYPTMGEASSSQLRIWAYSLPSLITQTGWYATLPANAVCFIRPENELRDIQTYLSQILENPDSLKHIGENGRTLLREQHTPEKCAAILIDLIERVQSFKRFTGKDYWLGLRRAEMGQRMSPTESEAALNKVIAKKEALAYGKSHSYKNLFIGRLLVRCALRSVSR